MIKLTDVRTAVVRIDVDPTGRLSADQLSAGMAALRELAEAAGAEVIGTDVAAMPVRHRKVRLLITGYDREIAESAGMQLCAKAFGTIPTIGVTTYVSRGTDDDAHGVLTGFGLTGQIHRSVGADGLDVVHVTVAEADLNRVPESRVRTALEAALNCQVHICAT